MSLLFNSLLCTLAICNFVFLDSLAIAIIICIWTIVGWIYYFKTI